MGPESGQAIQRHPWLTSYLQPIMYLKGAGPKVAKLMEKMGFSTLWDLVSHLPSSWRHYTYVDDLSHAQAGLTVLVLTPISHGPTRGRPYRIHCVDPSGNPMDLVFFHPHGKLRSLLPLEKSCVVAGQLEFFMGQGKMVHPDHIGPLDTLETWRRPQPVYPLTAGLTQKHLRSLILQALSLLKEPPSWGPNPHQVGLLKALNDLHHTPYDDMARLTTPGFKRLAGDEFLARSLMLQRLHQKESQQMGPKIQALTFPKDILSAFPFDLTRDQQGALQRTFAKLQRGKRLIQMLQGDVGSGKTAVAFGLMALMAKEGYQSVLMAPTEILARQHAKTLETWGKTLGLTLVVLTGQDKGRKREKILSDIAQGKAQMIVGTHALFQEDVAFHSLGFVVIDEQHRFGVHQRLSLTQKGENPHVLSMTATPIPRSLLLTLYGDLDGEILKEKPAHRRPVHTSTLSTHRLHELFDQLGKAVDQGHKIFWVCPLIEESEKLALTSAQQRYESLETRFKDKVGLIHGKMKGPEKDALIEKFRSNALQILVTTTVVEVGVDIPDATVMIIEHAERFGLSQLHQLRGRIGRGDQPGTCLLLYGFPLSAMGKERLAILKRCHDGFVLAREDLRLRGGGDLAGTRQSGLPEFTFVDLSFHEDLLKSTAEYARQVMEKDPDLKAPEHHDLRGLMALYGYSPEGGLLLA